MRLKSNRKTLAEVVTKFPLNVKPLVHTRNKPKKPKELPPRRPPPQHGLRIRLIRPLPGTTLKTAGYRIVVQDAYTSHKKLPVEQIGDYDPTPRLYRTPAPNLLDDGKWIFQKRLEWNVERLKYWMAQGARPTPRIVWLMQLTGISLDTREHKAVYSHHRANVASPLDEYKPDIFMPNDPKHLERLKMRANSRHYRNVSLEPGSTEWLEAQRQRPEMAESREFEAAQQEPYPLVPIGLQKDADLEPSRYARQLPVWVAKGSQKQIDLRAAALGRQDISKDILFPPQKRLLERMAAPLPDLRRKVPRLKMPPRSVGDRTPSDSSGKPSKAP